MFKWEYQQIVLFYYTELVAKNKVNIIIKQKNNYYYRWCMFQQNDDEFLVVDVAESELNSWIKKERTDPSYYIEVF